MLTRFAVLASLAVLTHLAIWGGEELSEGTYQILAIAAVRTLSIVDLAQRPKQPRMDDANGSLPPTSPISGPMQPIRPTHAPIPVTSAHRNGEESLCSSHGGQVLRMHSKNLHVGPSAMCKSFLNLNQNSKNLHAVSVCVQLLSVGP